VGQKLNCANENGFSALYTHLQIKAVGIVNHSEKLKWGVYKCR